MKVRPAVRRLAAAMALALLVVVAGGTIARADALCVTIDNTTICVPLP